MVAIARAAPKQKVLEKEALVANILLRKLIKELQINNVHLSLVNGEVLTETDIPAEVK